MARARSADYDLNREAILHAATRLFARQGYPGTSMSDLARECGISKALLYHYVSDKYELLREIAEGHVVRLARQVEETDALRLAPQARLRELIRRFMHEYAQARDDHAVLTQDVKFLSAEDRAHVLGIERRVVDAFAATVAAARPELGAAALDKPLTMLLFGMINWMFTWLRPDGALSHDDMAPIVADLFVGGLASVRPAIPTPLSTP
jgi:TetR/AcrR family transcriptional regulator